MGTYIAFSLTESKVFVFRNFLSVDTKIATGETLIIP